MGQVRTVKQVVKRLPCRTIKLFSLHVSQPHRGPKVRELFGNFICSHCGEANMQKSLHREGAARMSEKNLIFFLRNKFQLGLTKSESGKTRNVSDIFQHESCTANTWPEESGTKFPHNRDFIKTFGVFGTNQSVWHEPICTMFYKNHHFGRHANVV